MSNMFELVTTPSTGISNTKQSENTGNNTKTLFNSSSVDTVLIRNGDRNDNNSTSSPPSNNNNRHHHSTDQLKHTINEYTSSSEQQRGPSTSTGRIHSKTKPPYTHSVNDDNALIEVVCLHSDIPLLPLTSKRFTTLSFRGESNILQKENLQLSNSKVNSNRVVRIKMSTNTAPTASSDAQPFAETSPISTPTPTPPPPPPQLSAGSTNPMFTGSTTLMSSQTNLVRKHSCGDLVSRFKSRKVLGVGENSEHKGEIYRSKISQLLGHSEHLYTKYPIAFWQWYQTLLFIHLLIGFWNLLGYTLVQHYAGNSQHNTITPFDDATMGKFYRQLTGILYIVLASLLWRFNHINDKHIVRFILTLCSVSSLSEIVLIICYDQCNVLLVKNWFISFFCPSNCTSSTTESSGSSNSECLPYFNFIFINLELTIYLALNLLQLCINLLYHRAMQPSTHLSNSASSSLISTGGVGGSVGGSTGASSGISRRTSTYRSTQTVTSHFGRISVAFHSYLWDPIWRMFQQPVTNENSRRTSVTTPNMSTPATPTSFMQPDHVVVEEEEQEHAQETKNKSTPKSDCAKFNMRQSKHDIFGKFSSKNDH